MKELKPTTKQDVFEMIKRMPDDASLEDMMYALYVRQRIDLGLKEASEGKTVSHEEVKKSLTRWLQSAGQ
jgi:predicted transcriptional regulator